MLGPARLVVVAFVALAFVVGAGALGRRRHHERTREWFGDSVLTGWFESEADSPDEPATTEHDAGTLEWCAEGLRPIQGGGCLATPETPSPWPMVVYLHGIFDPAAATDELSRQSRVAARGVAKGFAVLALRGHVGQCSAPEYAARVCWPSNERNEDAGPAFIAEWTAPLAAAAREGAKGRRYVLGFSNGGYFAGLIAERGWFDAGAFVVARGGPVEPVKATGRKYPMLLTQSDDDPSHDEMVKLDEALTKDEWAHERFDSTGGHALPDADIELAVEFFSKQERTQR